jgi:hypothetical protein
MQAMHAQENGGISPSTCDIHLLSLVAKDGKHLINTISMLIAGKTISLIN